MKPYKIYLILIMLVFVSCNKPEEETFWISGFKTKVSTSSNLKVLNIHRKEKLNNLSWEHFDKKIEGFNFEEGYLKKIKVKKQGSKYTLIDEIEKKVDYRMSLIGSWVLHKNKGAVLKTKLPILNIFLDKMNIQGTSYCNNYIANIKSLSFNSINFDEISNPKKYCKSLNKEEEYLKNLKNTNTFLIKGRYLYFYDIKGVKVMTFKKQ